VRSERRCVDRSRSPLLCHNHPLQRGVQGTEALCHCTAEILLWICRNCVTQSGKASWRTAFQSWQDAGEIHTRRGEFPLVVSQYFETWLTLKNGTMFRQTFKWVPTSEGRPPLSAAIHSNELILRYLLVAHDAKLSRSITHFMMFKFPQWFISNCVPISATRISVRTVPRFGALAFEERRMLRNNEECTPSNIVEYCSRIDEMSWACSTHSNNTNCIQFRLKIFMERYHLTNNSLSEKSHASEHSHSHITNFFFCLLYDIQITLWCFKRLNFQVNFHSERTFLHMKCHAKFEVFTAMKILFVVFWFVTPCSDVVEHQLFGGPWYLHLQGEMQKTWIFTAVKTSNLASRNTI